jgi:hypothetical protein
MANAGNHNDTRLLKSMIKEGKLIKIYPNDNPIAVQIKKKFNYIVINDNTTTYSYLGKKVKRHSAWENMTKTLIYVNQLRFKKWYFNSLTL